MASKKPSPPVAFPQTGAGQFPQFPLYVPSKSRSQYMMTSKALTKMGIKHFVVVEPSQVTEYEAAAKGLTATILPLDMAYKDRYELCDDLGLSRSTGPGPARNFIWDHSIASGAAFHWVMDDNIRNFRRSHDNARIKCESPVFWRIMEDFVLRYENVGMAGPNYLMFVPDGTGIPPFVTNTRIYSCNLIRNDLPFRWRGRYNEDTILSLDMLKAGWCTIQFNAFIQTKMPTQTIKGGNTQEFYHAEGAPLKKGEKYAKGGTLAKSQMQVKVHPDVSRLVWRFGRWHHYVDYTRFKAQTLIRRTDLDWNAVLAATKYYDLKLVPAKDGKINHVPQA